MFVLDTNTVIYFFKGMGQVADRLYATSPGEVALPSLVLYELQTGIQKSTDGRRRRRQLQALVDATNVLPFGVAEANQAAVIRARLEAAGTPIGPIDTLIAATAMAANATLVTRNRREFDRVPGLSVVNWFEGG